MAESENVLALVKSTPNLVRLALSLSWTYLALGWKVRKARRAFEKQLMEQGISKKDAKQLSLFLKEFKNNITITVTQGLTSGGYR